MHTGCSKGRSRGFSLMELAVVLVVIGLILGAVTLGRDVQRNAQYHGILSDFVQGWAIAYDSYYTGNNHPPGDDPSAPTARVNGTSGSELCGTDLLNAFLAAGVPLPQGRAEGVADRYVYLDSNGLPHELSVCFVNTDWHEPGASVGNYVIRQRNLMLLKGVTPSLARFIDSSIDGRADASFGRIRELSRNAQTSPVSAEWSLDDRVAYGQTTATARDESQQAELELYFRMTR